MKKIRVVLAYCICLASAAASAQTLPQCPPEPENLREFVSVHRDQMMDEYNDNMKSRAVLLEGLRLELKATGQWDRRTAGEWMRETERSPEFAQSLQAMQAAQAAEDPALIGFVKVMSRPRDIACPALARYFQTKLDFFEENYRQFDIIVESLRARLAAIRATASPR